MWFNVGHSHSVGWNSSKIISRLVSVSANSNIMDVLQWEHPEILDGIEILDMGMKKNKKAQLSLTNPRDAKACQNRSNSTCLQRCR